MIPKREEIQDLINKHKDNANGDGYDEDQSPTSKP